MEPVGYAVVGLGAISQQAVLPAFAHSQNARLVAVVSGDREKALSAGCDDYDTKPVDFERLMSKILHWLDKK